MAARRPARVSEAYDPRAFPPVAVTVDVVVLSLLRGKLSVLLVTRDEEPFRGDWALPGGFVRPDENLDEAAARELAEETDVVAPGYLEQLRSYGDPARDPRMRVVTVAYVAAVPGTPDVRAGGDASAVRYWPVDDVHLAGRRRRDQIALAFDHRNIVRDALERLRAKIEYTTFATSLLDEPFTIPDLRRVYEAVWGVELEPANFRRKVLSADGFVEPVGEVARRAVGRPAALFVAGRAEKLSPPLLRGD